MNYIENTIKNRLIAEFNPNFIEIINESHKHKNHNVQDASAEFSGQTHFVVTMQSHKFNGLTKIACHRLVFDLLHDLMPKPIHALSLKLSA